MFRVLLIFVLLASTSAVSQENYPSKPIRWIVPYAAGGFADIRARKMGVDLAKTSRAARGHREPGGRRRRGRHRGTVAKAAPDGYTMGIDENPRGLSVNVSLMKGGAPRPS